MDFAFARESADGLISLAMGKIEAIIYDYDGLIVDTEDVWFQGCQTVCAPYGVTITEEHRLDLMRSQLTAYLVERFRLPIAAEALRPALYDYVNTRLAEGIPLMPGAIESVDLFGLDYPLGVGTGSRTAQVEAGLAQIGILDRFWTVVGGDQVVNGKPEPDIFLKVADELGIEPKNCLVFEDQPKGVRAAKAAGMLCVAVPNALLTGIDYSEANLVIPSLAGISLDLIAQIETAA